MPRYEVEIGGSKYEVEAPDENALSIAVKQIQSQDQKPSSSSSGGWSADNVVRTLGRGVLGVGSYLDEANAATNAALAPLIDPLLPDSFQKLPQDSFGGRYDAALEIQRGKDKSFDKAHPVASPALQVAGGVGSAVGLMRAVPAIGSAVLGNGGASVPAKLAAALGAGGATGAVQGFGAGEGGAIERSKQAGIEGLVGAGTGAAMIPVAAGVKKGSEAVMKALFGETDDALSTIGRAGRNYLVKNLSDPNKVSLLRDRIDELGPQAMLADVSPDWQGVARGAAARPGTRGLIVDPLTDRANMANTRLRADLDSSLGPAPIPSRIERGLEEGLDTVAEGYRPVMRDAMAVDTQGLAENLDAMVANTRGPEQQAIRNVRGYLNVPGTNELDPNPQALHASRQAIDGLLSSETNPQVIRQLTAARQEVDAILAEAAPGIKDVDAQFSELARQRTALGQGRPILNNEASALRPQEVEEMLAEGALPQGQQIGPSAVPTRMRQGVRAEIDRAVGTKANDTTALRNIVRGEGDWNRDKLGLLFGQENADQALRAIDRETIFGDTANRVTRGSDTAMGSRFGKFLDDIEKSQDIPGDLTMTGLGVRGVRALARALMQKNSGANASQVAEDIGRLSVAQGGNRDAIIQALMQRGEKNVVAEQRDALVRALLQGTSRAAYPSLPGVRD